MATEIMSNRVVAVLEKNRDSLCLDWVKAVQSALGSKTSAAETDRELRPMFDALVSGTKKGRLDATSPAFDELRAMLTEYSRTRARQGYTPAETATAVFALRDIVVSKMQQEGSSEIFVDFPEFSKFVDQLGLVTFTAFTAAREAVIAGQAEQLLELSTPVVKLWDGVVAVPLVGTLDSARTQVVMESLLDALVSSGSAHAIIDITGVPAVDTQVAQHLLKAVSAARLMGADCVISGIRPQIAQTIVSLGVDFGDIPTKASLADALQLTLRAAGFEVRAMTKRA